MSSQLTWLQVAEVQVLKTGDVRVQRVTCAVDCGIAVNPDTIKAQIQSAIIFGITAALYGQITLKDGRVEQSNFDNYQMLRIRSGAADRGAYRQKYGSTRRHGRGWDLGHRSRGRQRGLCSNRQALAKDANRHGSAELGVTALAKPSSADKERVIAKPRKSKVSGFRAPRLCAAALAGTAARPGAGVDR